MQGSEVIVAGSASHLHAIYIPLLSLLSLSETVVYVAVDQLR